MGHVLTFKVETDSDERRDILLDAIMSLLGIYREGSDAIVITLAQERPTARGKRKVVDTVTWDIGEPQPLLADFGIKSTQHEMRLDDTPRATETPSAPPSSRRAASDDDLSAIERMIRDATEQDDKRRDDDDEPSAAR